MADKPYTLDDFFREAAERNLTAQDLFPGVVERLAEMGDADGLAAIAARPTDPTQALTVLLAECRRANEAAIKKYKGIVISLAALDAAESALRGERVFSFCGGWPNLFDFPSADQPPLQWEEKR